MPRPLHTVSSIAVPMITDNVDTDLIIRVERLFGAVPRDELGDYAFETLRRNPDGSLNPLCPFNVERYRGAQILLAGANFGCGSAREGAVWALSGLGLRAILAPSFADIFTTNCYQNGILCVALPRERIEQLAVIAQSNSGPETIVINLETQTVIGPDQIIDTFAIPALRRRAMLEGLDDIELTMKLSNRISSFGYADRARRPWAYP